MIGIGWVLMCDEWAKTGGMLGAMLAFAVGSVFCIIVGLTYAELTPAIPEPGGSVAFSRRAMGKFAALIAGLATAFAYLGVASWEGPSLVSCINYLLPLPKLGYLWTIESVEVYLSWVLLSIAFAALLTFINVRGAKDSAIFQTVATAAILIVGLLFLIGAVFFGNVEYSKPHFTSTGGFMAVVLMVPAMFVGFDVIPQASSEMSFPLRTIPKLLIFSIIGATLWYVLMIFSTCMSAPEAVRLSGDVPVADAMAYAFNHPFWGKVCIIGGIAGILTSWNGFLFGAARCIYSMAQQGMLPAFLGKEHPKYGTPANATIFCGAVCIGTSFLGKGALVWFVNASSFGTVIMYAMVVLSFIVLRKTQPDMNRPYKVKNAKLLGVLGVLVVAFFVYLYLPAGPSSLNGVEWGMVLAWFVLGILLFILCNRKKK